jgi:hypothetical protein
MGVTQQALILKYQALPIKLIKVNQSQIQMNEYAKIQSSNIF